jgi:hypothetical protein
MLRYGGAAAILIALIGLVLVNPFGGDDPGQASAPPVRDTATVPGTSEPTTAATEPPVDTPSVTPSSPHTPKTTPTPVLTRETPTPTPIQTPKPTTQSPTPTASRPSEAPATQAPVSYQNCAQARAAGKAPLHEGDPGYSRELDRNGDGTACERGNS